MRELFLAFPPREVQNANSDDWGTEDTGNPDRKFLNIGKGQRQRGGFLPRITSLFQFLQVPEPEIESRVNEMDQAGLSTLSTLPQC